MMRKFQGSKIRQNMSKKCAWVTLVMMGDSYIPGAIILAESLREVKTKYSIVCMVTNDVSENAKRILTDFFDEVILVDYITNKTKKYEAFKQDERYSGWINNSFTKWSCLKFIQYDKVIFVDADMITVTNCDELFDLKSPAACYAWLWTIPWKEKELNIKNYYCPKREFTHGAVVHKELIIHSVKNDGYVGWGTMLSLEPDIDDFKDFVTYIKAEDIYGADHKCMNGADEQSIALFYANKGINWTNIHQQFIAIPWIPKWQGGKEMRALHYLARKPWDMHPEEFDDIKIWWKIVEKLIYRNPKFKPLFYSDGKDLNRIDIHLSEYILITDIRDKIISSIKKIIRNSVKSQSYNIIHIALSNLMISLSNNVDDLIDEILDLEKNKWTNLFRELDYKEQITLSFIEDMKKLKIFHSDYDYKSLIDSINIIIKMRLEIFPKHREAKIEHKDNTLSYGSTFKIVVTPIIQKLIDMKGIEATTNVLLKYRPLYEEYQYCLTQTHVDNLYENFEVRNEAFASPINSTLIGKDDISYYSLFKETDLIFGSRGPFFENNSFDIKGNWIIHPPNNEYIIEKIINMVSEEMKKNIPKTMFILIPYDKNVNLLLEHKHYIIDVKLGINKYIFRNINNETISTNIEYRYIILSNQLYTKSELEESLSIF